MSQDKAQLVFRHFAVLGERSVRAAVASEAAANQGQFWPYHDRLYDIQTRDGSAAMTDERLRGVAAELNLDLDVFNADLDDPAIVRRVTAETDQARRQGVQRTPTIYVNGSKVEGAIPYAELKPLVEQNLAGGR